MLQWISGFLWLVIKFVLPILIACFSLYYFVLYPKQGSQEKKDNCYGNSIFTIPNIIDFIGIILVPLGIYYYHTNRYLLSLLCLFLSGISDILDGYMASRLKQRSHLGEILDPIRDKMLLLAGLWILKSVVDINGAEFLLILSPLIIGELGIIYLKHKNSSIKIHSIDKVRQAIHLFFIFLLFLNKFNLVFFNYLKIENKEYEGQIIIIMGVFSLIALAFYLKNILFGPPR